MRMTITVRGVLVAKSIILKPMLSGINRLNGLSYSVFEDESEKLY